MSPENPRSLPGETAPGTIFSSVAHGGKRRRWWLWLAALLIVGVVAYLILARNSRAQAAIGKAAKAASARAVPVVVASARTGDMGVYITGLGTVTALNTVTVRSRVDGELDSVAYHEGQFVREGDLLAQIDPRPFEVQLTQAQGQMAKDEAGLANAKVDLERYQVLIQQDSIPRQQLDTQAATVAQLEAAIRSDQGQVDSARLNLIYCKITAPISGRVGLRLVDAGNIVHATDSNGLLVITQLQPIAIVFAIPADQLPPVLAQMRGGGRLVVDAYDRDMKKKLASGALIAVDNQIDASTGTVRLKAQFPNADNALFANQFVNARLLVNNLKGVTLVSAAAIQRSPQSTFVWVVKPDSSVEMRNVEVQLTEGDQSAIRGNVGPGEQLVVDGVDKLQPGSKVAVAQPDAKENARPAAGAGKQR